MFSDADILALVAESHFAATYSGRQAARILLEELRKGDDVEAIAARLCGAQSQMDEDLAEEVRTLLARYGLLDS